MLTSFLSIDAREEIWPLKQPFRISRGSRNEARVVIVTVTDGKQTGRGEAVPLARYNQSIASVLAQIESVKTDGKLNRQGLQELMPAGAARNALDCALWDLEAKVSGKCVWELANFQIVPDVETSFTISVDTPFAQDRFAKEAKINNVTFFSDYRGGEFGKTHGLLVKDPHILSRSVMVVDKDNVIRYLQVTPELAQLPDMDAAFAAARKLVQG